MPIYVYQCAECEGQTEKRQGFADAPLTTCEGCGGSLRRVLQPVGIVFKGSGFYVTDYKRAGDSSGTSAASTNGKSEGGDTKPAAEKAEKAEKKEPAPAAAPA